jgi:hypothetical protein
MLTRRLEEGSDRAIVAGVELKITNSGEVWHKGTAKFAPPRAPLDVELLLD